MKKKTTKDKLVRGDYQTIAELTGYSKVYVRQVLNGIGKRKNAEITKAAELLTSNRSKQFKELKKQLAA